MGVTIKRLPNRVPDGGTELNSADLVTKETTVDGMTYAWGPGQVRNFADDGVGIAHGAFDDSEDAIIEDGRFMSGNTGNLNPSRH